MGVSCDKSLLTINNTKNKSIVLSAVKSKGISLKFADTELQTDYEVVSNAVQQDGKALEYASY